MTKTREKVINILIDNSDKYISGEYMSDISPFYPSYRPHQ